MIKTVLNCVGLLLGAQKNEEKGGARGKRLRDEGVFASLAKMVEKVGRSLGYYMRQKEAYFFLDLFR